MPSPSLADQQVALTCDDAPAIAGRGPVRFDPAHMDTVREVLTAAGVPHCVAFVVGSLARGEEKRLERWLSAGFELGNHADDHVHASRMTAADFLASVKRCNELLASVGGAAATRWFRFPYLDRGADARQRAEIQRGLVDLGCRVAPASADFYDYAYEEPFVEAANSGDTRRAAAVGERYRRVATGSIARRAQRTKHHAGRRVPLIAFFHFGPISSRFLGDILRDLAGSGVRWCPLEPAVDDAYHASYVADAERNGLVTEEAHQLGLGARLVRKLARSADARGFAQSRRLGPRWPHIT